VSSYSLNTALIIINCRYCCRSHHNPPNACSWLGRGLDDKGIVGLTAISGATESISLHTEIGARDPCWGGRFPEHISTQRRGTSFTLFLTVRVPSPRIRLKKWKLEARCFGLHSPLRWYRAQQRLSRKAARLASYSYTYSLPERKPLLDPDVRFVRASVLTIAIILFPPRKIMFATRCFQPVLSHVPRRAKVRE